MGRQPPGKLDKKRLWAGPLARILIGGPVLTSLAPSKQKTVGQTKNQSSPGRRPVFFPPPGATFHHFGFGFPRLKEASKIKTGAADRVSALWEKLGIRIFIKKKGPWPVLTGTDILRTPSPLKGSPPKKKGLPWRGGEALALGPKFNRVRISKKKKAKKTFVYPQTDSLLGVFFPKSAARGSGNEQGFRKKPGNQRGTCRGRFENPQAGAESKKLEFARCKKGPGQGAEKLGQENLRGLAQRAKKKPAATAEEVRKAKAKGAERPPRRRIPPQPGHRL